MMLAMTLISSNDVIVKLTSQSLHIGQLLLIRGCAACLIFALVIKFSGRELFPPLMFSQTNLLRASCEMGATLCFVTGLSMLPIAIASTLVWTAPLLLTVLAAAVLGENVRLARWSAVFVGFVGVLFVTNPRGESFSWIMLLPVLAAVLVACRDIATRRIDPSLHSFYITFATLIMVTLMGLLLSIFQWQPVETKHIGWLALSAVLLSGGFFFQVSAIRLGELSFVSPFAYWGIVVAVSYGILIWNEVPTPWMVFGMLIVAGSGLFIFYRENRISRKTD